MRLQATHPSADNRAVSLQTDDLFVPNAWREPMQRVLAGACERRPVMLLISAEGRGKSTFLACLGPAASVLDVHTEVFTVAARHSADWLASAAAAFDSANSGYSRRDACIEGLRACLIERAEGGVRIIIALDDADTLPRSALAEIVAFVGGWPNGQVPVTILLTGTSDLAERLAEVAPMREMQGCPRVSIAPWGLEDLTAYIRHRLARQRGGRERFSPEAINRVHELSAGEPLTVSQMVTTALSFARRAGETAISRLAIDYAATALFTGAHEVDEPMEPPDPDAPLERGTIAKVNIAAPPIAAATTVVYPLIVPGLADSGVIAPLTGAPPSRHTGRAERSAPAAHHGTGAAVIRPPARRRGPFWIALAMMAALVVVGGVLVRGWLGGESGIDRVALPVSRSSPAALPNLVPSSGMAPAGSPWAANPDSTTTQLNPGAAAASTGVGGAASGPADGENASGAPGSIGDGTGTASLQDTAALIGRGDALMLLSDVTAARQFYLLAARSGVPAALTAVAGTYDPVFLQETGVRGARGDARQAIDWYRDAVRRGDSLARMRLAALVAYMKAMNEIDDVEARRLLNNGS